MSIPEAVKGAKAELARLRSPGERLARVAVYARIFAAELLGTVLAVPFGWRALALHRSLPDARRQPRRGAGSAGAAAADTVSILRDVRYGPELRSVMDVYLPAGARLQEGSLPPAPGTGTAAAAPPPPPPLEASSAAAGGAEGAPVALFVHGGVWAAGAKWHYTPLATRLAQAGVVTAVMQYSLYPAALVPQMVAEVGAALTWVLDAAGALGGSPARVSLVGHSAGAQLAGMALLRRALARRLGPGAAPEVGAGPVGDTRMPAQLVGMAGVYDLTQHYEYERGRDVHELSTMQRAVGGAEGLPAQSPLLVLTNALSREAQAGPEQQDKPIGVPPAAAHGAAGEKEEASAAPFCREAEPMAASSAYQPQHGAQQELAGEAIARRIGFFRASRRSRHSRAVPVASSSSSSSSSSSGKGMLQFTTEDAASLPPTVLMSSCTDEVVPWYESADMYWALHDCGVPARKLVYTRVGHADFVTGWRALPTLGGTASLADTGDLPAFSADLVQLVAQHPVGAAS